VKLQTRLSLLVSILVVALSSTIGFYSIETTKNLQIEQLDSRLASSVDELSKTSDDPLSLAILLADQSEIKFSVAYISSDQAITTIYESPGDLTSQLSLKELMSSTSMPQNINQGDGLRIRAFPLPDEQYLVLSFALKDINDYSNQILKDIFIVAFILILLGITLSFLLFRRDYELNSLAGVLQLSQDRMQTFLGDASHELRTPLSVIKGYFELLTKRRDLESGEQEKFLARINTEVARMEEIISDLLLITELEQGSEKANDQVNISDLLGKSVQDLQTFQPERKIHQSIPESIFVCMPLGNAQQLIANLFSNIRHHTPRDSTISINLVSSGKGSLLTLEDAGPGLPKKTYEEGIQAFQRFDKSRSRQSGGSGLGMTIMRKIVESQGGSIQLSQSSLGGLKTVISFS
jgi:two-component system, OmpR family, sensor kinase